MNYIGSLNDVTAPVVRANGVPVSSARVSMHAGTIPVCEISMRPEDVGAFVSPDQFVNLTVNGDVIFGGYLSGAGYSNMHGSISAGISLIHAARDLEETRAAVPGLVPASTADTSVILYGGLNSGGVSAADTSLVLGGVDFGFSTKPFSDAICDGLIEWVSTLPKILVGQFPQLDQVGVGKTVDHLNKIKKNSSTGMLANSASFGNNASAFCNVILKRGGATDTIWDLLSSIVGGFNCQLICLPSGATSIQPSWIGVKARTNEVQTNTIIKFDKSSSMRRSPGTCTLMATVAGSDANKLIQLPTPIGSYTSSMPGAAGSLMLVAPGWLSSITVDQSTAPETQQMFDGVAKALSMDYTNRLKTCNLVTAVCPGVFPGVCAKFNPVSGVVSFDGNAISAFEHEIDGYCSSIEHILEPNSFSTVFSFECALETDIYQKQPSHPTFPDATMLAWT